VKALRERYESDITFEKLDVLSVFPEVHVSGERVTLRYRGRQNVPPLASIRKFSVEGSLLGFLRSPRRFSRLELDGLEINVTHSQEQKQSADRSEAKKKRRPLYPFVIAEVVARLQDDASGGQCATQVLDLHLDRLASRRRAREGEVGDRPRGHLPAAVGQLDRAP